MDNINKGEKKRKEKLRVKLAMSRDKYHSKGQGAYATLTGIITDVLLRQRAEKALALWVCKNVRICKEQYGGVTVQHYILTLCIQLHRTLSIAMEVPLVFLGHSHAYETLP